MNTFKLATAAMAAIILSPLPTSAFEPTNVQCVAPADPGGGLDFACRTIGRILSELDLVKGTVQTLNMPGGTGAVAFGYLKSKKAGDPNTMVTGSTIHVTQIAQGKYPGKYDDVRWTAMIGADVGAISVSKNSTLQTLADLAKVIKETPGSLAVAGGSAIGGWDHIRFLMFARAAGLSAEEMKKIKWVQFDAGGPAVTQMMGGHIDVLLVDLSELVGFIQSGDVRILSVLSENPLPDPWDKLPTARQQGFEAVGYNWRGFYLGNEVSDDDYKAWVDIFDKVYKSPNWQKAAKDYGLMPLWKGGAEFEASIKAAVEETRDLSKAIGVIQ